MATGCFGNPHSLNPSSLASTELVERARRAILAYFNAPADDYAVIFTANASAACRLVGEAYYVPTTATDLRVCDTAVHTALGRHSVSARRRGSRGLFAYPAQSNFSGVQHPLDWVEVAHRQGYDVLLDAAAYLPTNALDLSVVTPEFVTVSWYKLFGYPTGVGCLIARREALARLRRPWFSGGTIQTISVQGDWHSMVEDEGAFEDGTLNFLGPDLWTPRHSTQGRHGRLQPTRPDRSGRRRTPRRHRVGRRRFLPAHRMFLQSGRQRGSSESRPTAGGAAVDAGARPVNG